MPGGGVNREAGGRAARASFMIMSRTGQPGVGLLGYKRNMRPLDRLVTCIRRPAATGVLALAAIVTPLPALAAPAGPLDATPRAEARPTPVSRGHRAWRPSWWPSYMPAGTGQPGIVVSLRYNRVYAHDGYRGWNHFPAATGKEGATPRGRYHVVSKVISPSWTYKEKHVPGGTAGNPLGAAWLGLGMPPGWGKYPVGIHGTNAPWSIGYRVSKGCVRLRNRDIMRLYRMVPVGCPVWIVW